MHSLRWKFFAFFVGLGLLASLGVGIVMYVQYDRYITRTYTATLNRSIELAQRLFPLVCEDIERVIYQAENKTDAYGDMTRTIIDITESMGITFLYFVQKHSGTYRLLMSSDQSVEYPYLYAGDEMTDAVFRTSLPYISKKPITDQWGTFISMGVPVFNNGIMVGLWGADYDVGYITTLKRMAQIALLVSLLLSGAVAAIFALTVSSSLIKPIRELKNAAQTLAKGDLTQSFTMKGKDELAEMSQTLNQAREGIKKLILSIKNETATISGIGNDLAANMNQTAAAVNEITANVQSIKNQVMNQSSSVRETNSTMKDLVQNINKLDGHVGNQSSNVSQASSAIEQMVANINSVTQTLVSNTGNVQTLKEASEVGHSGLQEVSQDIQEIVRNSEGLLEINAVMGNIASQTNLLSMNAAIEAAHAGEAGKGFAVVADEIRKLAESSGEQSKTIGTVLKKIKSSIDNITKSTENVLNNFAAIDTSVKVVAEQEENIRRAMEEQGIGSKQILEGVGNVNEITRQVKSGSHDMYEGAKEVIRESENLEKATAEITVGMNEMANGANQINLAVNHVNEISGKNREAIDVLMKEVANFICDTV